MKIILSRKGFDSSYGKIPSPILPDGTLLSLPIPSKGDPDTYSDISFNGQTYYDIITQLNPRTKIKPDHFLHLDPDIRAEVKPRENNWTPAFGQGMAALGHLKNQGVGMGDIFLFFGWFRQTELKNGKLSYVKDAPDLQVIYGYFQIGGIITCERDVPEHLRCHPHARHERWDKKNVIFTPMEKLSLSPDKPGTGCLSYNENLVLTKKGCKRSTWSLPEFFRHIPISYNANSWRDDCFMAPARGQEFVFDVNDEAMNWVKYLLSVR